MALDSPEAAPGGPAARLRLRDARWLLALVLGLQLLAWSNLEGYQLADSVEYMDRAVQVVEGEPMDPGTVRSFAFSGLFVPAFGIARLLGLGDAVAVLACRGFVMALGLTAVFVVARLTARHHGRPAGFAAGLLVGANPVFLQWSVEPVSGTAAMLCIALALERALEGSIDPSAERGGLRRGLALGAWLGLALLMAFKTLVIAALMIGLLALRDRWRGRAQLAGILGGFALGMTAQSFLDLWIYGSFGSSLVGWLADNVGGNLGGMLWEIGAKTGIQPVQDLGLAIYNAVEDRINAEAQAATVELSHLKSRTWYLENLTSRLLSLPLALCFIFGAVRGLVSRRWAQVLPLAVLAAYVTVLCYRGSQSFRLWLPVLPFLAVVAAAGWGWVRGGAGASLPQRAIAWTVLVLGSFLGLGILGEANTTQYGGYWRAMDRVARLAEDEGADADTPWRVGAAYHWAARFRAPAGVDLVRLPHHLDTWHLATEEERAATVAALGELDAFVSHQQLLRPLLDPQALTHDPAVTRVLADRFEVDAAFWDPGSYGDLEPVLVLRRRTGDDRAPVLYDVLADTDPEERAATLDHPLLQDYRRAFPEGDADHLRLLGWDARVLPGSGNVAWITLEWEPVAVARDYTVNLRVTDPEDRNRQVNRTAWGVAPTSTWEAGTVVRDGFLVALPAAWHDFGGPWARGEVVPARLWVGLPRLVEGRHAGGLQPWHASLGRPVHKQRFEGRLVSDEGFVFSGDSLLHVGGFWMPIPPGARVVDDGRPLPPPPPAGSAEDGSGEDDPGTG